MKYRLLTDEELKELEEDFKHFLISNNVYDDEWRALNEKNDDKVLTLIEMFSDIVFDKALKNVKFLEHITPKDIKCFRCGEDKMILIGIVATDENINFMEDSPEEFMDSLEIFKVERAYNKTREEVVFQLLESGCSIVDEERFKKLELAYTYSQKQIKN